MQTSITPRSRHPKPGKHPTTATSSASLKIDSVESREIKILEDESRGRRHDALLMRIKFASANIKENAGDADMRDFWLDERTEVIIC